MSGSLTSSNDAIVPVPHAFDLCSADTMFARCVDAIGSASETRLVLDFRRCRYVDSAGLGALVRLHVRFGKRLKLIVPSNGSVWQVLTLVRLTDVLDIGRSFGEIDVPYGACSHERTGGGDASGLAIEQRLRCIGEAFADRTGGSFAVERAAISLVGATPKFELRCRQGTAEIRVIAADDEIATTAASGHVAAQILDAFARRDRDRSGTRLLRLADLQARASGGTASRPRGA